MKCEHRVARCQHAVNCVAQLMRQRGHVAYIAGVILQHVRRHARQYAGAKCAAAFPRPHFSINLVLIKHAPRGAGHRRRKLLESVQHKLDSLIIRVGFLRPGKRCVDIVAAQFLKPQQARLHAKPALKHGAVLAAGAQQGCNHRVWNVVVQIAHSHSGAVATQLYILCVPVTHAVSVNLRKHQPVLCVHAVQLLVCSGAQRGIRLAHTGHQRIPRQLFCIAINH